ncbi:Ger(x)C family spore germination protein [Paenibacillus glycanilyticus]|uniref:Ger(x)C family spore germination protein n=1 Tax=Paenibacillus glycanilyticus TaxID=126569 RepID=UPI00203DDA2F|nr:Ger(x)C family spore germination protein [Paenibacillus glycanilyticus]MCM3628679.1 Ger(x)C family spore germination protein [Paenibacillus glycanilyticus]
MMLISIAMTLASCWNRRELNDLAIALAIGIDKAGDQYLVSVQVVDPGEVAANNRTMTRTPVTLYQAKAQTILEAIRKMTTVSPRSIYAAHLRMLIIGEDLAREGIGDSLEYMSRYYEHRTDFYIAIAKGTTAASTLKILTHLEAIPANLMFSSLQASQKEWAPTAAITLDQLIMDIVSKGKDPVVTGLRIKGDREKGMSRKNVESIASPAQLQYSGLAIFEKDRLVGWLDDVESRGYSFIHDDVSNTVGVIKCPDGGKITLEVIRSKTTSKAKLINGKPEMRLGIRTEVSIGEVMCKIDLTQKSSIYEMEHLGEETVRSFVEKTINEVQENYKVDIFGFGEVVHRAYPAYWKTVENEWDSVFRNMPVKLDVVINIRQTGTVNNSFMNEMK